MALNAGIQVAISGHQDTGDSGSSIFFPAI